MNRILVIAGGVFQALAGRLKIVPNDLVLYADAAREIDSLGINDQDEKLAVLTLGQGETVPTLIEKVKGSYPKAAAILGFFNNIPAVDLSRGMGMWAPLGRMSLKLLKEGENGAPGVLKDFLIEKVFNPVFEAAKGTLTDLDVISLNSFSGGAGGGVGHMLSRYILDLLNTRSEAVSKMCKIRIGAITFNGLGDNIIPNAGIRLAEDLVHTLAKDRHPREIRLMWLVELPILKEDNLVRNQLTMQLTQAFFSTDVQRQINISLPNVDKPLDGIKVIKAAWWDGIIPRLTAAYEYDQEILKFVKSLKSDPGVCSDIRVDLTKEGDVWSISNLQDYIKDYHQALSLEEAKGNLVYNAQTFVIFNPNDEKRLMEHKLINLPRIPQSLEECKEILEQYMGLKDHLKKKLDEANEKYVEANNKLEMRKRALERMIASLESSSTKKGFWASIGEKLRSKGTIEAELKSRRILLHNFLQQVDLWYKTQAEVFALEGGLNTITTNLEHYHDRLRRLRHNLEAISGGEGEKGLTYMQFKPFSELFGDLLELSEVNQVEALKIFLDDSVKNVTLRGLGAIAGLSKEESETLTIVKKLLNDVPPFPGPNWGGKKMLPQNSKFKFLVFPPMKDVLRQEVKEMMTRLESDYIPAFCDTNVGGINVVSIDVHRVGRMADILTPLYMQGLRDALQTPELYQLPDVDVSELLSELT